MPPAYLKGPSAPRTRRMDWWCEGKEPFESAIIAHEVAARRNDKHRQAYRCATCGVWHLGRPMTVQPPHKVLAETIKASRPGGQPNGR